MDNHEEDYFYDEEFSELEVGQQLTGYRMNVRQALSILSEIERRKKERVANEKIVWIKEGF